MARKGEAKTGGRVAGTPNKFTASIRELAGLHGPIALAELAGLVHDNFTLPWVWLNRFARVRCKQVFILLLLIGSSLSLR
jgi:hypothetical protein